MKFLSSFSTWQALARRAIKGKEVEKHPGQKSGATDDVGTDGRKKKSDTDAAGAVW